MTRSAPSRQRGTNKIELASHRGVAAYSTSRSGRPLNEIDFFQGARVTSTTKRREKDSAEGE